MIMACSFVNLSGVFISFLSRVVFSTGAEQGDGELASSRKQHITVIILWQMLLYFHHPSKNCFACVVCFTPFFYDWHNGVAGFQVILKWKFVGMETSQSFL